MYVVYVLNKEGNPLMPTKRFGHVRRLLKSGQAKEVYIRGVFKDRTLLDEAFEKYGIVDKQPEPTKEEQEKNQLRCIRNVMNDFSVTVEQAMFMLDIEENKWGRYTELLAANVQIP